MEIAFALLITSMLILVNFFYAFKVKCIEDIAAAKIGIFDVEYAFMIRRIRENNKTYALEGIDGISVRISKEDFDLHKVEIGKIWVYDGIDHYCVHLGQHSFQFE